MKSARKPFVAPRLREEASLAGVTLISGGVPTSRNCRKGSRYGNVSRRSNRHGGRGT
jgi:hypothetical protein